MTCFQSEVILTGLAQPGEIPLMHAAGTDNLELEIASEPPLDFAPVLGQNFQRARADGPQPDHPQAQGTLRGSGVGEANSR